MAPARASSGLPQGYVEDKSKGAMLRFEDSLPRLPVPSLDETAKRYLKSLHPLLTRSELDYSKRAVADFIRPGGQGEELQKRLIARRDNPDIRNWLHEWWNDVSYLGWRDPVVPYVSYFYSHRDDRRRRDPSKRAAAITTAVLEFKRQVDEKTLEPEYMRKLPMAMSTYEFMFNACRVPAKPSDYPVKYDPQDNAHIIVVRKNQFFKVQHVVGGKQLNTTELEAQFRKIYVTAEKSPAIGALTSQNRDAWTEVWPSFLRRD
jgi:carnitine O-acetyltransferase